MVFLGGGCVLGAVLLVLGGALLTVVEISVVLGGVELVEPTQVESGVLLNGSSAETPWIAMPTSTPSNAEPSTAEPPAVHSARTAVLLVMLTVGSQTVTPRQVTG